MRFLKHREMILIVGKIGGIIGKTDLEREMFGTLSSINILGILRLRELSKDWHLQMELSDFRIA